MKGWTVGIEPTPLTPRHNKAHGRGSPLRIGNGPMVYNTPMFLTAALEQRSAVEQRVLSSPYSWYVYHHSFHPTDALWREAVWRLPVFISLASAATRGQKASSSVKANLRLTGANPKATVTVRYVRGGLVDGPGLPVGPGNGKRKKPAASRVVVGRVYVEQAGVPMIAGVTNLGSTLKASSVLIKGADGEEYDGTNDPDDRTPDDQVGSLLLALTGADGEAVLDFDFVVGPDPGAKIWFNIEAIVEVASFPTSHDENEPFYFDLLHDALEDKAYSQWDFPNSTEQRTLIKHMP